MPKQSPDVLKKFDFLESILRRYESNSYKQLCPLVENPQIIHESFGGKTIRMDLYAAPVGHGELYILLSELVEWSGQEIRSWYSVGFKKNDSEKIKAPVFNKRAYCPFCEETTNFTTDLPLEDLQTIFHCNLCRNFFNPTFPLFRFLGIVICLFLSALALFSLLVGLYIFAMYFWQGLLFNRYSLIATFFIAGGGGTLYLLIKKIKMAFSDPMLKRVSDYEMYSVAQD